MKIGITGGLTRPGFGHSYYLDYKNEGVVPISNIQVKFKIPNQITIINVSPINNTQVLDTLIWNIGTLLPGVTGRIVITDSISALAVLGDTIEAKAWIYPIIGDSTPVNNFYSLKNRIQGSYDPNDKTVSPEFWDPDQNEYLTYTIRFQNTGTDTAFTVYVVDTLDNRLDLSTFEMISSSHNYYLEIQNSIAKWIFRPINLLDSTSNEAASHGFIQFKIKPLNSILAGTQILNDASIYFDYNQPIITNNSSFNIYQPYLPTVNQQVDGCKNKPSVLTATNGGKYLWYTVATGGSIVSTDSIFTTPNLTTNITYFVENVVNGCTSARIPVQINLTDPSLFSVVSDSVCFGNTAFLQIFNANNISIYDSLVGGNLISNDPYLSIPNLTTNLNYYVENVLNGCTSARVPLYAKLNNSDSTLIVSSCKSITINGELYNSSGTKTQVLVNSKGCDSTLTILLTILPSPTASFLVNGNDLTASPSGLTYQWLFNGNPISGANSMNYAILQDGIYSIVVTDGICSDTSATQNVVYMGLNSMISSEIKIFPNPTHGKLTIEVQNEQAKFELYDLNGKLLISKELNSKVTNLDLQNIAKGLYLVKIKDLENKIYMQKLVVE